jgi:hypothetical protein
MKEKCDKCGQISDIYFEWQSILATLYRLKFCHFCGKNIEATFHKELMPSKGEQ